jgi:hypothetical protein
MVSSGGGAYNVNVAKYLVLGASNVFTRVGIGGTASTGTGGNPYIPFMVGDNPFTEPPSGVIPLAASAGFKAPTITGAAGTMTNAYTVYIEGAPTATVTEGTGALWVDAGETRLDGNLKLTTPTTATTPDSLAVLEDGLLKFTLTANQYSSGKITSTVAGVSNVASITGGILRYTRVGKVVDVTVIATVTATAPAVNTSFTIDLPIASAAVVGASDLQGYGGEVGGNSGQAIGTITGKALFSYTALSTSATTVIANYKYDLP